MNFEVKMTEGAMDIIVNNVIKWGGGGKYTFVFCSINGVSNGLYKNTRLFCFQARQQIILISETLESQTLDFMEIVKRNLNKIKVKILRV